MTPQKISENKGWQDFLDRFGEAAGEEIMERIADAAWNGSGEGIVFREVHQINACNHIHSGTIVHSGETFAFSIESGDMNGTVIYFFGSPDDYAPQPPPKPARFMFVPSDDGLELRSPHMFMVYLAWTKTQWFKEKLAAYHYDRHYQPGCAIEDHYREWAVKKGMKIARIDD